MFLSSSLSFSRPGLRCAGLEVVDLSRRCGSELGSFEEFPVPPGMRKNKYIVVYGELGNSFRLPNSLIGIANYLPTFRVTSFPGAYKPKALVSRFKPFAQHLAQLSGQVALELAHVVW